MDDLAEGFSVHLRALLYENRAGGLLRCFLPNLLDLLVCDPSAFLMFRGALECHFLIPRALVYDSIASESMPLLLLNSIILSDRLVRHSSVHLKIGRGLLRASHVFRFYRIIASEFMRCSIPVASFPRSIRPSYVGRSLLQEISTYSPEL